MSSSNSIAQLSLYYQDKYYCWSDLQLQIKNNKQQGIISGHELLFCDVRDALTASVSILSAFIEHKAILPVAGAAHKVNFSALKSPDTALAIYTSGSQAQARIALLTRQNIIAHCQNFIKIIPVNDSSIWLNCMPLQHIAGVMIIFRCWFNRACMVLHEHFDAGKIWYDIQHLSVSHISLVPRMLFKLLEVAEYMSPPESLKYVLVGGDKLTDELYQRALTAGWPVYISYGMTESTSTIALGRSPQKLTILQGFDSELTDKGILKIRGAMLFSGYAHTTKRYSAHDWFITHDKVILKAHHLSIIGRDDYMIICGGRNIAPEYIEALIMSAKIVNDIAIGKHHNAEQGWGDSIVALFTTHEAESQDAAHFKLWLKKNINTSYRPVFVFKVDSIPRNAMAKVNRRKVAQIINTKMSLQLNDS